MALSDPRIIFGVHSFSPYKRNDGSFYGTLRVLQSSSFTISGELVSLNGGSARFPWAVEDENLTGGISLTTSEYPDFLFELFLGKAPTSNAAEAAASVTSMVNVLNTSVLDAVTGIASVGVKSGSEADVKFSKYIVKAVSSTTVDVFASSNIDFATGTDKEYESDLLKITASPLTIVASTATEVPGFGVELTGGSGTIGITTGDSAEFYARPVNTGSMDIDIGASTDIFPEFGAIMMGQKRGNSEMLEIEIFKAKGIGMPIGLDTKAFSEAEISAEAFIDAEKNKVFSVRHVEATV